MSCIHHLFTYVSLFMTFCTLWIIWVFSKLSSVALFLISSFSSNLSFVSLLFSCNGLHSINTLRWIPKFFTNKFYFPSHIKHQSSKALSYLIVRVVFPLVIIDASYCHEASLKIWYSSWLYDSFVHNIIHIFNMKGLSPIFFLSFSYLTWFNWFQQLCYLPANCLCQYWPFL